MAHRCEGFGSSVHGSTFPAGCTPPEKLVSQAAAQEQVKVLQKASATAYTSLKLGELDPRGTIIPLTSGDVTWVMSGS